MSKTGGSSFTYNDPFKSSGKGNKVKTVRSESALMVSGTTIQQDPAALLLNVDDIQFNVSILPLNLEHSVSDIRSLINIHLSKDFLDSAVSVDEGVTFGAIKVLTDLPVADENLSYILARTLSNTSVTEDFPSIQFNKSLSDDNTADEFIIINPTKSLFDSVDSNFTFKFTAKKLLTNTAAVFDDFTNVVSYRRRFVDTSIANSRLAIAFEKPVIDTSNADDFFANEFTKAAFNEAVADDTSFTFNISKLIQDSAYTADLILAPDGLTYQLNTPENELLNAEDDFEKTTAFNRTFVENIDFVQPMALMAFGAFSFNPAGFDQDNASAAASEDILTIQAVLNKSDFIETPDVQIFEVSKPLSDATDAISVFAFRYDKPVNNIVTQSDDDVIFFTKSLREENAAQDFNTLDVSLDKKDASNVDDTQVLVSTLRKFDTYDVQDIPFLATSKPLSNTVTNEDDDTLTVGKNLLNFSNISDDTVFDISKLIQDEAVTEDLVSVPDGVTYSTSKTIRDFVTAIDEGLNSVYASTRGIGDLSTVGDSSSLTPTKGLFDGAVAPDFVAFDVDKVLENNITADQLLALSFATSFSDTYDVESRPFLNPELFKTDSTNSILDNLNINYTKVLEESQVLNDSLTTFITKVLKDSVGAIDAFALGDGLTYRFDNPEADAIAISDIIDILLSYIRLFKDDVTNSDDVALDIDLNKTNSISAEQSISLSFATSFDDSYTSEDLPRLNPILFKQDVIEDVSDTQVFNVGLGRFETINTAQFLAFAVDKQLDEQQIVNEDVAILTTKPIVDNNVSLGDVDTLQFTKGVNNALATDDDQSFDISKLIKDQAITEDLVSVPDGATYIATKNLANPVSASELILTLFVANRRFEEFKSATDESTLFMTKNFDEVNEAEDTQQLSVDKLLDETLNVEQSVSLGFETSFDNTYDVEDTPKLLVEHIRTEDLTAAELFIIGYQSRRLFKNDAITDQFIAFDVALVKDDASDAQETIFISASKALSDSVASEDIVDAQSINPTLGKSNFVTTSQNLAFAVEKFLEDSADIDDLVGVPDGSQYYATKNLRHTTLSEDLFARFVTYNRAFDNVSLTDDDQSFTVTKGLRNVANTDQSITFSVNKLLEDATNTDFSIAFDVAKPLDDDFTTEDAPILGVSLAKSNPASAEDLFAKTLQYNRLFDNSSSADQSLLAFDVSKVLSNDALAEQLIKLAVDKLLDSGTSSTDDESVLTTTKGLSHTAAAEQSLLAFDVAKLLKDSAAIDDLVGVPDGSQYYATKRLDHIATTEDLFDRVVNYNRVLNNASLAEDDQSFIVTKALSHTASTQQEITFSVDKLLEDAANTDFSIAFDVDKLLDNASTTDDTPLLNTSLAKVNDASTDDLLAIAIEYNRTFTNSSSADQSLLAFDVSKVLLSNNTSAEQSLELSVDKLLDNGTSSTDDESVLTTTKRLSHPAAAEQTFLAFDIAKLLKDSSTIDDLVGVPDGSQYYATKRLEHIASAGDLFARLVTYNRVFNNASLTEDDQSFEVTKALSHTASTQQEIAFSVDKLLQNSSSTDFSIAFDVTKLLDNASTADDTPLLNTTLLKTNFASTDDLFAKTLQYNRLFDNFSSAEQSFLAFGVNKVLSNNTSTEQSVELTVDKLLDNGTSSTDDESVLTTTKGLSHPAVADQSFLAFDVEKLLEDDASIDDLVGVPDGSQYYATKRFSNIVSNSDLFDRVVDYDRTFDNSVSNIDDNDVIFFTKALEHTAGTGEDSIFTVIKRLNHSSIAVDDQLFDVSKLLLDNFVADEEVLLNVALLQSGLPEAVDAVQFISLATDKALSNPVTQTDDDTTIQFTKGLSHPASPEQTFLAFDVEKLLEDSADIDDLVGVPDGSQYYATKRFGNSVSNSDLFINEIEYRRLFQFGTTNSDTQSFDVSKVLSEIMAPSSDQQSFAVDKFLSHTTNNSDDAIELTVDKLLENATSQTDFSTLQFGKGVSNSSVVDDANAFDVSKPFDHETTNTDVPKLTTSKPFSTPVAQTDEDTIQFGKGVLDDPANTDDSDRFDVTKLLKDISNIDDLIGVPDGSLYYFSKSLTDASSVSQVFSRVFDANRKVEDSATALLDLVQLTADINKFEEVDIEQTVFFTEVGLSKESDNSTTQDNQALNVDKGVITEDISSSQELSFDVGLGTIDNDVEPADEPALASSKTFDNDETAAADSGLLVAQNYTEDNSYWAQDYVGESRTI